MSEVAGSDRGSMGGHSVSRKPKLKQIRVRPTGASLRLLHQIETGAARWQKKARRAARCLPRSGLRVTHQCE